MLKKGKRRGGWRVGGWAGLAAALLVAPRLAIAGPPLITDDPETVEKGHWEINIPYTLEVSPKDAAGDRTWSHETPLLDMAYGLFDGHQLKLEVPMQVLDMPGEGPRGGLGDLSLGYKWRLVDEEQGPLGLSVYPQVSLPLGDSDRGFGTGSPALLLPVQIGKHFLDDKLYVYGDVGYDRQYARDEVDTWGAGIAVEGEVTDRLTLCGELRYSFGVGGEHDDQLWQLGAKVKLTDSLNLLGAAGRSFNPGEDGGSDLLVYLGIQLTF